MRLQLSLLFSSLLFLSFSSFAQIPEIAVQSAVTGSIIDSITQIPLEFGSVVLVNQETKAEMGMNSDSSGHFTFKNVEPGKYNLVVFYAGYPKTEIPITVASNKILNMGKVLMKADRTSLKEVKIVSFRELIETKPDGIVYNAEKDGTNQGTTADELLRKVPMVTVDLDGNVQMRGSGNVKVLIDGKPSTIIAASVKDALKQIPSDNIKSVEVITSPGAKYDAEGTAGVINIITKRNIIKGINGMLYTGLKYNFHQKDINGHGGFNLNYRNNKFGLSAYLGGGSWTNLSESSTTRTSFPNTANESILKQTSDNDGGGQFFWSGLSADYEIDSLNSVQAGFNLNPGNWHSNIDQNSMILNTPLNYNRDISMNTPTFGYSINGSYNKKFKNNPKQTLDILALYSSNTKNNNYQLDQRNNIDDVINYREENKNDAVNNEFTGQIDYAQPFKKHGQKLEAGFKFIQRNVSSDYSLFSGSNGNGDLHIDTNRTNALSYQQQVASAYAQFSSKLAKNLNAIVGMRYEYTAINGNLRDRGGDFNSDYQNFLPNAILAWDLKGFNKLKIAYNQRIERPSIDYINPYINFSDPFNITQGNPKLEPEVIHNIEFGYSKMFGQSSINTSLFWRRSNNAIEPLTTVGNDGIGRTTYGNFADNTTWGLNAFGSTRLFEKWAINLTGNLYFKDLHSPSLNLSNDGIEYDFNMYSSYQIIDGLSVEGFGMYRGNKVMLQGSSTGYYYYRIGVKKTIFNGKGNLTLGAENFFTPGVNVSTEYTYNNAIYRSENTWYGRGIRIGFSYRFGKMSFSGPKKSIKNDDLKDSEESTPGDGNQMMR